MDDMPVPELQDTIVAVSTPPGRGGIGVVRLSGPRARDIVGPLLRLRQPLGHAQARFGYLLDPSISPPQNVLDEIVVTLFAAPSSYTSEDVVEIAAHGSPVLLDHIVRECIARGARLAQPGEFTQRAFLAGRLDLTQIEAVQDLIESTTLHQARVAASQLGGSLSRQIAPIKEQLVQLIAGLEAGIDFADDDVDLMRFADIGRAIEEICAPLHRLEHSFAYGRLVRDGFSLAIIGRPNAGKSSLFNALLERERAIVTASPGTTRDLITEWLSIGGVPVELSDTAGIRTWQAAQRSAGHLDGVQLDEAETLGIAKSQEAMAEADLLLLVIDASLPLHEDDLLLLEKNPDRPWLIVLNKSDLIFDRPVTSPDQHSPTRRPKPKAWLGGMRDSILASTKDALSGKPLQIFETSSMTRTGIPELRDAIHSAITIRAPHQESAALTNIRQHDAVAEGVRALQDAHGAVQRGAPHEMLLIDLHRVLQALDMLTGVTTTDDILKKIFSSFCIGK